jgi:hypothetical protein
MPITLDAIYQPLQQFFLQTFGQGGGTSAFFCFANLPVGFYEGDFLDPSHPEWGPQPALGIERFTSFVDRIPKLDTDLRGVWFNQTHISDLYHDEILFPSLPILPTNADGDAQQAAIAAFSQIKADAISKWENCRATSILSPGSFIRRSNPTPQGWWNQTDPGVWGPKSFDIQGAATIVSSQPQPPNQLLRMKIQDRDLQPILMSHLNLAGPIAAAPSPAQASGIRPMMLSRPALMATRPVFAATLAATTVQPQMTRVAVQPMCTIAPAASVAMHSDLIARAAIMPFNERMELQSMLAQSAPTQTVTVTDVTISFDFLLVTVDRPWMHNAFLNNTAWYVPGQSKGMLTNNDGHGVPALPVAFVALKNLRIVGPWTPTDITNLEQSVQFGPFLIDSTVDNGAIGHPGIQVVGWVFQGTSQGLLDLPPVGDPQIS